MADDTAVLGMTGIPECPDRLAVQDDEVRTVDFHLRNVFAQLGILSRTKLAALRLETHAS